MKKTHFAKIIILYFKLLFLYASIAKLTERQSGKEQPILSPLLESLYSHLRRPKEAEGRFHGAGSCQRLGSSHYQLAFRHSPHLCRRLINNPLAHRQPLVIPYNDAFGKARLIIF